MSEMHKGFLKTAAILGALSILLGAFAAHSLRQFISDYAFNVFETGVRYQFYHVFALLFTAVIYKEINSRYIRWAGIFFIAGIILFSGSLYGITILNALLFPRYSWIGAITPVGGLSFILGWVSLFVGCIKKSFVNGQ